MKFKLFVITIVSILFIFSGPANAAVIDFTGGTAYNSSGTPLGTTNNSNLWTDQVAYYIEDGFRYDFTGGLGTVGDYYSIGSGGLVGNDVIHAHWFGVASMIITSLDGSAFDLNYIDVTSNSVVGGGQADGTELSYISNNSAYSMLLPSSDWGFATDYFGAAGDGVARLWLDSNFDSVTSVTFTSRNAYCFGLDNFYINEEPPPPAPVPEPATIMLLGSGLLGLAGFRKKMKK